MLFVSQHLACQKGRRDSCVGLRKGPPPRLSEEPGPPYYVPRMQSLCTAGNLNQLRFGAEERDVRLEHLLPKSREHRALTHSDIRLRTHPIPAALALAV